MSLQDARMLSLRDKIEAEAEKVEKIIEKEIEKDEKVVKKIKKLKK